MNSFGWAIKQMQDGRGVMREVWKGRGEWLEIQTTDLNSKMQTAYIYIRTTTSAIGPWTPSQADMLAVDWIEAIWPATRAHEPKRCTHPPLHRINGLCLICNEKVGWVDPLPCTHPLAHREECNDPRDGSTTIWCKKCNDRVYPKWRQSWA